MNARANRFSTSFTLTAFLLLAAPAAPGAFAQETGYAAMEGVTSIQTAFDFRVGDADVALGHLNLIHAMLDDPSMIRDGDRPRIVVVFIGPSVNLVSTDGNGYPEIADKVEAMEADGVRFEICMTAAGAHDVSAASILPEIIQVGNGWISLIGYQEQGYAMIADF